MDDINRDKGEVTSVADFDDVFVGEQDDFTIVVRYYKKDKDVFIEDIDVDYNKDSENIKELNIVFRYPKYGDYSVIQSKINFGEKGILLVNDIMALQYERMFILFKSWNLSHGVEKLKDMNIKITKCILDKIHAKINMEGIL